MAAKNDVTTQNNQGTQVAQNGQVNDKFITSLIQQVKQKQELGLSFPSDYNPANELMGAYLVLKETTDKNGKPVLEVCSQASVAFALMSMVNKHLSMLKGQCYPIAYGGKLQVQPSVYGNIANARRYNMVDINASPIFEGDEFKFHMEDGKKVIDKHEMTFESIDNQKIKGAYAVALFADGTKKSEVMTMAQIKQAWQQGFGYKENGNGTHQKFTDQMCEKTVKNRLIKHIIRTHGEPDIANEYERDEEFENVDIVAEDVAYEIEQNANSVPFEAIEEKPEPMTAAKAAEKEPVAVQSEQPLPDFMKAEG
ncbi:MAG: recombinase RecT [Lachnospiraceae bacterium]|nr:recombinase RecT [Lachnospiraceae bacterium]